MKSNLVILSGGKVDPSQEARIVSAIEHSLDNWRDVYRLAIVVDGYLDLKQKFEDNLCKVIKNSSWEKFANSYTGLLGLKDLVGSCIVKYSDLIGPCSAFDRFIDHEYDIVIGVVPESHSTFYANANIEKIKFGGTESVSFSSHEKGEYWYHGISWLSCRTTEIINQNFDQLSFIAKKQSWLDFLINMADIYGLRIKAYNTKNMFAEIDRDGGLAKLYLSTKGETLLRLKRDLKFLNIPKLITVPYSDFVEDRDICTSRIIEEFKDTRFLAVRSSSVSEDTFEESSAGKFQSLLDVDHSQLSAAIDKVFASYTNLTKNDHVIIQEMVDKVSASGVIFSRTLNGENSYQLSIAYGTDTSVITSGKSGQQETYYISRYADENSNKSFVVNEIISLTRKIETFLEYNRLDIEFVVSSDNTIHIVQVRPLIAGSDTVSLNNFELRRYLYNNALILNRYFAKNIEKDDVQCSPILSNMSDWNPAEILGSHPKSLDLSLYEFLITDSTWAIQREQAGYKKLVDRELLREVLGRPFVDVRKSLKSFIPSALSPHISNKLLSGYLQKLKNNYELHDKIEFDVAVTCFTGNEEADLRKISEYLSSDDEQKEFLKCLRDITKRSIEISLREHKDIERIKVEIDEIIQNDEISDPSTIGILLRRIRDDYALNFSHLARCAFVAVSILRNNFTGEIVDKILMNVETVNKKFLKDAYHAKVGTIPRNIFYETYGHLRPGTYNISSPCYSSNISRFMDPAIQSASESPCVDEIDIGLFSDLCSRFQKNGVNIDSTSLWLFLRESIEGRELSKFQFTRLLSYVLEKLQICSEELGFDVEEIQTFRIDYLLNLLGGNFIKDLDFKSISELVIANNRRYEIEESFILPDIMSSAEELISFKQSNFLANFIGSDAISGKIVLLDIIANDDLNGKVVCIPFADPGYDWIFGSDILGLVTEYGGSNSHMAIRCAELGITAAIGVGGNRFNEIRRSSSIYINPKERKFDLYK